MIKIAILAPSSEAQDAIANSLPRGVRIVETLVGDAFKESTQQGRLRSAEPQVVLVETLEAQELALAVRLVYQLLPGSWIFAVSEKTDPELIIETVRAGAREFLTKPLDRASLAEALDRYASEHRPVFGEEGKVFTVTSAKGGAGSTSIAINLASSVSKFPSAHVALVDLIYPLGDITAYLNLKPKYTLADAVRSVSRLDPVLLETFVSQSGEVSVLAGPGEFGSGPAFSVDTVSKILSVFQQAYSHTIVDASSASDEQLIRLVSEVSEAIVVVLTPEIPALWRTLRLLELMDSHGAGDKLKVVLNRSHKKDEITRKDIEKTLGRDIFWSLPNDYRASIDAINAGKPLVSMNHSGLAGSFKEFTENLTGMEFKQSRKGLFDFFSS
jgi:pilus assembly protein CpaE